VKQFASAQIIHEGACYVVRLAMTAIYFDQYYLYCEEQLLPSLRGAAWFNDIPGVMRRSYLLRENYYDVQEAVCFGANHS
jgi:hypothetical protein